MLGRPAADPGLLAAPCAMSGLPPRLGSTGSGRRSAEAEIVEIGDDADEGAVENVQPTTSRAGRHKERIWSHVIETSRDPRNRKVHGLCLYSVSAVPAG